MRALLGEIRTGNGMGMVAGAGEGRGSPIFDNGLQLPHHLGGKRFLVSDTVVERKVR